MLFSIQDLVLLACFVALFAPIGCVSLWRRCIYLSDGLSHASLLAFMVSGVFSFNFLATGLVCGVVIVSLIYWFENSSDIYVSTSVVTAFAVALAFLLKSIFHAHSDILACDCFTGDMIFGDLNFIFSTDLLFALFFGVISFALILFRLRSIVLISFDKNVAKILGIKVGVVDLLFFITSALFINVAVKILGFLLLSSILIFPSLMSKLVSTSPFMMIINSVLFGIAGILSSSIICMLYDQVPLVIMVAIFNSVILFTLYVYKRYCM